MDKKIIEKLKTSLEEQKKSVQKELESFATKDPDLKHNWDTKFPKREDADKEESADDAQEYDNALSLEYSLEMKLKDVNLALEKITTSGNYGICESCGKKIDEERLMANPSARTCLKCNQK